MKIGATLKDYQRRDAFLVKYIKSQLLKAEKQINDYDSEGHGKKSAYEDILYKLTKDDPATDSK